MLRLFLIIWHFIHLRGFLVFNIYSHKSSLNFWKPKQLELYCLVKTNENNT